MEMAAELVARVAVMPQVMKVVIALEQAVVLDHPVGALADIGLEDGRSDGAVVVGRVDVADVVQQGRDDGFLVRLVAQRPRRALQRVLVAIDPVAERRAR
jgi:hypothetical protein